ncbi:SET domain-containing protein 5 [Cladorrhinum sp. PSN259]|nr:SET domain-containing protein 5 [Cladorrhinum sp. PSN259]
MRINDDRWLVPSLVKLAYQRFARDERAKERGTNGRKNHEMPSSNLSFTYTLEVCTCPLPIAPDLDGEFVPPLTPLTHSPWSFPPQCEASSSADIPYYCLYSNSHQNHLGFSLITTPEVAAEAVSILNSALPANQVSDPSYKVVDIPGKGKGVVATRKIKKHEEIMVDYAALVVDVGFTVGVEVWRGYKMMHLAVDQLSERGKGDLMGLVRTNPQARDEVEDVLRTNAFSTELGGRTHMAIYTVVSRINHGCMPNAYTRFMQENLQVSVGAAKDIEKGEEITISYLVMGKTSDERKKALKQWGFQCTCDLCTASPAKIKASDARRRQIDELREHAVGAFQANKPYQALRLTRQVLNLLPAEELFTFYSEQYENMARIFYVLGDKKNAELYARKSLEVLAEQGYLQGVRDKQVEFMWRKFSMDGDRFGAAAKK